MRFKTLVALSPIVPSDRPAAGLAAASRRRSCRWFAHTALVVATLAFASPIASAQAPSITEYSGVTGAVGITADRDGALWFTERDPGKIGRISLSGAIAEVALPNPGAQPLIITTGPDGAFWFTELTGNNIGRITAGGVITEYAIPTANASPQGITTGPDGALWFVESGSGKIGRITTTGEISEFPWAGVDPNSITTGPDGALWLTDYFSNKIGRITTSGVITEYNIPTASSGPFRITMGPDGALWFTESLGNKIGRITPTGGFTEYDVPTAKAQVMGITTGPDGALWFAEYGAKAIGRITTAGTITEYAVSDSPYEITVGPDGAVWFAAQSKIGRVQLPLTRTGALSHIAAGATWATLITMINANSVPMPVTVKFHSDDGSPLTLPLTVTEGGKAQTVTAASVDAILHPNATLLISVGEQLAALTVGWAEVVSTGTLSGFAIFQDLQPNGADSEGTVPLQTQFSSTMVLPFDNTGGFRMGVAITNLSSALATLTATIWDESGNPIGTETVTIAGNGHTSFVLPVQLPLTAGRRGIVRFQSSWTDGLAGLGLRFSPTHTFTSLPNMQ